MSALQLLSLEGEVSQVSDPRNGRATVVLTTLHRAYFLAREGGDPSQNNPLERLVGRYVRCLGWLVREDCYRVGAWEEIPRAQSR